MRKNVFTIWSLCLILHTNILWAKSVVNFKNYENFNAATPDEIRDAPCRTDLDSNAMEQFIATQIATPPLSSKTIKGFNFVQQNELAINDVKDLIDGKKNNPDFESTCSTIICAMEQIFGKTLGLKILYLKMRYGFNSSDLAYENSARFTESQIDIVLKAVRDFPDYIFPLAGYRNKKLIHFKHGYTLPEYENLQVTGNAEINLFDLWDSVGDEHYMEYIVFHELSHYLASSYNYFSKSKTWKILSNWGKTDADTGNICQDCFISTYAKNSSDEDWAESLSGYRYAPKRLKEIAPAKYELIKEVIFNGIEYIDENSCDTKNLYMKSFVDLVKSQGMGTVQLVNLLQKNAISDLPKNALVDNPRDEVTEEATDSSINENASSLFVTAPLNHCDQELLPLFESSKSEDKINVLKSCIHVQNWLQYFSQYLASNAHRYAIDAGGFLAITNYPLKNELNNLLASLSTHPNTVEYSIYEKLMQALNSNMSEMWLNFQNTLATQLLERDQKVSFLYDMNLPKDQFCTRWSSIDEAKQTFYGYQYIEKTITDFTGKKFLAYYNAKLFSYFLQNICLKVINNTSVINPSQTMTLAPLKAAISDALGW